MKFSELVAFCRCRGYSDTEALQYLSRALERNEFDISESRAKGIFPREHYALTVSPGTFKEPQKGNAKLLGPGYDTPRREAALGYLAEVDEALGGIPRDATGRPLMRPGKLFSMIESLESYRRAERAGDPNLPGPHTCKEVAGYYTSRRKGTYQRKLR